MATRRDVTTPLLASFQQQQETTKPRATKTALVILNAPIPTTTTSPAGGRVPSRLLERLWRVASYRVCADGGANRLRQAAASSLSVQQLYIPNAITGDLDSLTADNRRYYEQQGVPIVRVEDQDRNDLDKAIAAVLDHFDEEKKEDSSRTNDEQPTRIQCVVYGAFGGRFDQEMASMQALYRYNNAVHPQQHQTSNRNNNLDLFLYDDNTMAFLIPAGETCIRLALPDAETTKNDSNVVAVSEGPTCGLIPLGGPVRSVTTHGLQWDLQQQSTQFGGLVSTSNRMVAAKVTVECSEPIVFTAEIHAGSSAWSE